MIIDCAEIFMETNEGPTTGCDSGWENQTSLRSTNFFWVCAKKKSVVQVLMEHAHSSTGALAKELRTGAI
jgi:hypothetical protein